MCRHLIFLHADSSKVNDLLLADLPPRLRPSSSHGDIYMMNVEESPILEPESSDMMDLASFLEYVRHRQSD